MIGRPVIGSGALSGLLALVSPLAVADGSARFRYSLDLNGPEVRGPVAVPGGARLEVSLADVVPSARYRITTQQPNGTARVVDLPARVFRHIGPSSCAGLRGAVEMLRSARDEAQVAVRVKALDGVGSDGACSPLDKALVRTIRDTVRPSLGELRQVASGEELTVVIERMGPDGAERRWTVTFRGGP